MTAATAETRPSPEARTDAAAVACPFCGARHAGALCLDCGRDKTAPRRICARCHAAAPRDEPACQACGQRRVSELRWKIPLIVALFAAAFALAVALRLT